jgi:hypothetical protein
MKSRKELFLEKLVRETAATLTLRIQDLSYNIEPHEGAVAIRDNKGVVVMLLFKAKLENMAVCTIICREVSGSYRKIGSPFIKKPDDVWGALSIKKNGYRMIDTAVKELFGANILWEISWI